MRILSSLLIIAMIGVFFVGCQESTTLPGNNDSRMTGFAPVSPSTDYVLYGVSSGGDALSILDPITGVTTLIGPLDPDLNIFVTPIAMAIRSCNGAIYVWNNSNKGDGGASVSDGRLLTVDRCTGLGTAVNTEIGSQGQLAALAFHPDGRLFGTDSRLVEIDLTSGEVTEVGRIGVRVGGADFHPVTGVLYGAELGSSMRFGTINIETGTFTEIDTLDLGQSIIGSLAFDPSDNKLYGTAQYDSGELFEIDIETAAVSNIVPITGVTPQGMGFSHMCGEEGGDCGDPEETEMTLVIKPGGCPNPLNPKSKGVLPMALLGSEGLDIDDIDVSSIEINGVSPLRSNHADVGGPAGETMEDCECAEGDEDGILDLTLKFSTQAIVATLGTLSRGDVVELTLTGMLSDGTTFEASECMVIVGK
jgi:hypothetical protein